MIAPNPPRWIWFRPPPPAADPWGESRPSPGDALGHLRRTFSLEAGPTTTSCRVTADGRYELWVNGTKVGRGPARSDPSLLPYDEYDIGPLLRPGPNVVAALVRHYGRPTLWWRPGIPEGELGYGSFLFETTIEGAALVSGPGWKASPAAVTTVESADAGVKFVPPPTEGPPPLEVVDGASVPWGWTERSYDDAGWVDAYVMTEASFEDLEPRGIPRLAARAVVPVAVVGRGACGDMHDHPLVAVDADRPGTACEVPPTKAIGEGTWAVYDLGEIVNAHPFVELDAAPGAIFDLACGEDLTPDGRPVTAPREWAMRVVAAGRAGERHESFEAIGFRYLSVAARTSAAPLLGIGATEMLAPRTPGAYFRCSDPLLEEIWRAGARSVDLCTTDAYIDCPGREQRAWVGDLCVTSLIRAVLDPDLSIAERTLRLHARGARPDGLLPMVAAGDFTTKRDTIPDSTLLWIVAVHGYYDRSGDVELATELLPIAERGLAWFERFRSRRGLLERVPGWVFIDWAQTERGPHIAALDALYAWALELFAQLCDVAGNHGSAQRARTRAATTRAAFESYWDEGRGVYVDAIGDRAAGRVSQQTNSIAIVARCAPRNRWDRMLAQICDERRLRTTLTPGDPGSFGERMSRQWQHPPGFDDAEDVVLAQPFFAHFLHRALDAAGRRNDVITSLRRWRPLVERGNGCLEEYWDAEPGLGSRCHAWSATPVYDLATTVLGVRGMEPGMRTISITPHLGDLGWAEGAVATPHGFVSVRAERGRIPEVTAPDGVRVVVAEPVAGSVS